MSWRAILGFRLVTADLDRSSRFYTRIGFTLGDVGPIPQDEMALLGLNGSGRRLRLRRGATRVDLDCFDQSGRMYPAEADSASLMFQHLALVTGDAARAWEDAERAGAVPISRGGPVTLPRSAGSVTAIKFRDPDGHPLEFLQFSNVKARRPSPGMLGIDHSALSVSDVLASLAFYETHGLRPLEASFNHGPTQITLDNLDGVEVDVVPLRPTAPTPHLELLAYRHPRGRVFGRVAANDIAATRVVWHAGRAELVRDPDGHLHQLEP